MKKKKEFNQKVIDFNWKKLRNKNINYILYDNL